MTVSAGVWEAAALRGLDGRARADLALAAREISLAPGQYLYSAGEPADHLYVVVSGALVVDGRSGSDGRVTAGDTAGEDALVFGFGARARAASAGDGGATVVGLPAALLKRVLQRSGSETHAGRLIRAATRAAVREALVAARLDPGRDRIELVLDGARLLEVGRGDVIVRAGEARRGVYVVVDGVVRLEGAGGLTGHLSRGRVFRPLDREARVVAAGPAWLALVADEAVAAAGLASEVDRRSAEDEGAAARVHADAADARALTDLARLETARSLLVLDGDACVRCGHCASACSDAHSDQRSRLRRAGPIVGLSGVPHAILSSSCEHCRLPACLPSCPTGAIARTKDGTVLLAEDLCTGCGSCVKACPWENLALAKRLVAAPSLSAEIAVKCDLCHGRSDGPACVSACPTAAIQRVDASALPEVGRALGIASPQKASAPAPREAARPSGLEWAVACGLAVFLLIAGRVGPGVRLALGVASVAAMIVLVLYGAMKRAPARVPARLGRTAHVRYVVHVLLGVVALGAAFGHAAHGGRATTLSRAAFVAFILASVVGGLAAGLYRTLPSRLSRLVRREWLPEESADEARALAEHVTASLSGRTDLLKAVYARILGPYRRSPLVRARLLFAPTTLDDESKRLIGRVRATLEGRGEDRLEGLGLLTNAVVEETSFRAARLALALLRALPPIHVTAALVAAVLVLVHAFAEVVR